MGRMECLAMQLLNHFKNFDKILKEQCIYNIKKGNGAGFYDS